MTISKNKQVARVGHEFAAAMTADTPIIEIAKMVSRLANALDEQTALLEQFGSAPVSKALTDIIAERQRQQSVEGWTPEHDDEHRTGELARGCLLCEPCWQPAQ